MNRSRYTVSTQNPAEAVVEATFEGVTKQPGMEIRVTAQTVTRSNAAAFHHTVESRVDINGHPHYTRSWAVSVPRKCN